MERITFTHEDRSYAVREELKTLRTNIQFCGDDKRVLLVTSCLAGEGKSTTTQELAESLSEIDKRVLYIDADLRKDKEEKDGLSGQYTYGLTHYLSGQCTSRDMVYSTNIGPTQSFRTARQSAHALTPLGNERGLRLHYYRHRTSRHGRGCGSAGTFMRRSYPARGIRLGLLSSGSGCG